MCIPYTGSYTQSTLSLYTLLLARHDTYRYCELALSSLTAARAVVDVEKARKLSFGSCARWQIAWPRPSRTELTKRFMLMRKAIRPRARAIRQRRQHIFKNLSKICLCEQKFAWSKFAYGSKKIQACPVTGARDDGTHRKPRAHTCTL